VTISRRIARPLLASIFIAEGWDAIRNPDGKAKSVTPRTQPPMADPPFVPEDSLRLVRVNGIVQVSGGVLLAIGKYPRLAALALMVSIAPTTYAGHRFWQETDDEIRAQQRIQLLKNLGLLGGLIYAVLDTEGAPSLGWRTRQGVRGMASSVTAAWPTLADDAHQTPSKVAEVSRTAGRRARKAAKAASRQANVAGDVARQANEAASNIAKSGIVFASPYIRHANESALDATGGALDVVAPHISAGFERVGELLEEARDVAGPFVSAGIERAEELLARGSDHLSLD
jgi:uncharacterized membrane protein YphA (DoxX/SURF4 family)